MKSFIKTFFALALSAAMLCGCMAPEKGNENSAQENKPAQTGDGLRTGLYTSASYEGSSGVQGEADGLVKLQATFVAVTVDEEGRIEGLMIDQVQSETGFDAAGMLTGQAQTGLTGKRDLDAAYGMASVSSIGREWNEQIQSFEQYCIGKTVQELKEISFNEQGKPTDPDLASSVTLSCAYFVNYIEAAVNGAQPLGAEKGDSVALAVTGSQTSRPAEAGEEGSVSFSLEMAAVTTAADGTITSCIVDGLETEANFAADGSLISDPEARPQTKNQLAEAYGMKAQSSIGKEWYEQAEAFAQYVCGKTADQVEQIVLDQEGRASEPDLRSSVTIRIADFTALTARAARIHHPEQSGETEENG